MSPLKVVDPGGEERFSKTKVTAFIGAVIGAERAAEALFGFHLLPVGIEDRVGPVIDSIWIVLGFLVIKFRGKKG